MRFAQTKGILQTLHGRFIWQVCMLTSSFVVVAAERIAAESSREENAADK